MYPKDLMMFAEGDAPAPAPAPAEPTPAPAAPEPGTVPAEPAPEPIDPHKAKIDALQNSLDAALEELSKGNEPTPAPAPAPAAPVEPAKPAAPAPAPVPTPAPASAPVEEPKGDAAWKAELERIQRSNEEFQTKTIRELEAMKLKDEMIGLTAEVQAAITQYPNADADRILLEIESGSDKTVAQIAADLHTNYQTLVDKISKEQEERIKAALAKENEGRIKVPQSSGTSSTPTGTPDIPGGPVQTKAAQDAAWAQATREAKANIQ